LYSMGRFFEEGLGVPKDRKAAVIMYQYAAERGHAAAKKSLERLSRPDSEKPA